MLNFLEKKNISDEIFVGGKKLESFLLKWYMVLNFLGDTRQKDHSN